MLRRPPTFDDASLNSARVPSFAKGNRPPSGNLHIGWLDDKRGGWFCRFPCLHVNGIPRHSVSRSTSFVRMSFHVVQAVGFLSVDAGSIRPNVKPQADVVHSYSDVAVKLKLYSCNNRHVRPLCSDLCEWAEWGPDRDEAAVTFRRLDTFLPL